MEWTLAWSRIVTSPSATIGALTLHWLPMTAFPATDIECHAGAGAELEVYGDVKPAPEMRTGRNDKVTVDFDIPFKIRPFLCKIRISFFRMSVGIGLSG